MDLELVESTATVPLELDLELFLLLVTGNAPTEQGAPTPSPPHVRVGATAGGFPSWITF